MHFLRLLAAWWPEARSARDIHLLACSFAKYSSIRFFSLTDLYISNLSSIACFMALIFYKTVWHHMQWMGGIFNNHFTANLPSNHAVENFSKSVKIWQRGGRKFVASVFDHTLPVSLTDSIVDDHDNDEFCWQHDGLAVSTFSKSGVWHRVPEGSTIIFGDT